MKEQVIFNARMQIAALRQLLRDRQAVMNQNEIDLLLDQIGKLQKLIEKLTNET